MGKGRTFFGVLLSVIYCTWILMLVLPKLHTITDLTLNEVGDFCAGLFGPLAFLWLVLGYLQQGEELRQNNVALSMQARELKASVEQQVAMVQAQRESLHNYENSLSPLLKLSVLSQDVEMLEAKVFVTFTVCNMGEYCEQNEVFFEESKVAGFQTFFKNEDRRFFAEFDTDVLKNGISLKFKYLNRGGVAGEQSFEAKLLVGKGPDFVSIRKLSFLT